MVHVRTPLSYFYNLFGQNIMARLNIHKILSEHLEHSVDCINCGYIL